MASIRLSDFIQRGGRYARFLQVQYDEALQRFSGLLRYLRQDPGTTPKECFGSLSELGVQWTKELAAASRALAKVSDEGTGSRKPGAG